jgi:hypothetical protein
MNSDAIALIFAGVGVLLVGIACQRVLRAHFLQAAGSGLLGITLLGVAALTFVISLNLHTYARLTREEPVAQIVFEQRGEQRYRATLTGVPAGDIQVFMLNGDDWQIDARVLKWQGWANLLGLDAQYRLERIAGRYRDIEQERRGDRTVYALSQNPGLDLWEISLRHRRWLPFVDAIYGSATYLPMAETARYEIRMTQTGLIARPLNPAAQAAAGNWNKDVNTGIR